MNAGAVIVAAGSGTRMGRPKQFLPLLGHPVVEWTLKAFLDVADIEEIVLVLSQENMEHHGERLRKSSPKIRVVSGGATRMGSVRNGIAALSDSLEVLAVHDGARPLITPEIIKATLEEAYESGAALPAVPVKDTLKKVTSKELWISSTPVRSSFWLAQTPQCYRREILEEALTKFAKDDKATDESQLVERAGHRVKVVPSTYENLKITTPEDLDVAEAFLLKRYPTLKGETRTGFGFDIHKMVEGRELWLAGLKLEHGKGLLGHSDGDAALHAACDAAMGATGLGEIGELFPPDNPKIKGIPSREIVAEVLKRLEAAGASLMNLDVTIVAEEPKMKPHYPALRESMAKLFKLELGRVNLKAKSHEGIGTIGRGNAIACYAVATVAVSRKG